MQPGSAHSATEGSAGHSDILGLLGVSWPSNNQEPEPATAPGPDSPRLVSLEEVIRQPSLDPFPQNAPAQTSATEQPASASSQSPLHHWEQTQLSQLRLSSAPAQSTAKRRDGA